MSAGNVLRLSSLPAALVALLGALPASAEPLRAAEPGPQATQLGTVEVQEAKDAVESERALTPGAVSVVDVDTFYERPVPWATCPNALRYVPGLWTESGTGGDAVFISSRGSNLDATDYDSNGILRQQQHQGMV